MVVVLWYRSDVSVVFLGMTSWHYFYRLQISIGDMYSWAFSLFIFSCKGWSIHFGV